MLCQSESLPSLNRRVTSRRRGHGHGNNLTRSGTTTTTTNGPSDPNASSSSSSSSSSSNTGRSMLSRPRKADNNNNNNHNNNNHHLRLSKPDLEAAASIRSLLEAPLEEVEKEVLAPHATFTKSAADTPVRRASVEYVATLKSCFSSPGGLDYCSSFASSNGNGNSISESMANVNFGGDDDKSNDDDASCSAADTSSSSSDKKNEELATFMNNMATSTPAATSTTSMTNNRRRGRAVCFSNKSVREYEVIKKSSNGLHLGWRYNPNEKISSLDGCLSGGSGSGSGNGNGNVTDEPGTAENSVDGHDGSSSSSNDDIENHRDNWHRHHRRRRNNQDSNFGGGEEKTSSIPMKDNAVVSARGGQNND